MKPLQEHAAKSSTALICSRVSGAWVFRGTRLPVATIFENLGDGLTVEEIVEQSRLRERQPQLPQLEELVSKEHMRKRLASLGFSEKIKILERLRDRSLAIAASGLRGKKTQIIPAIGNK